jgi:hypothetical protein
MVVPRRRVDLVWLPTWAQYLVGAAVAVLVGALIWVSGRQRSAPDWYLRGVEIAAVVLLLGGVLWLVYRLSRPR